MRISIKMGWFTQETKNGMEVAFYSGENAREFMQEVLDNLTRTPKVSLGLGIENLKQQYTIVRDATIYFGMNVSDLPKNLRRYGQ